MPGYGKRFLWMAFVSVMVLWLDHAAATREAPGSSGGALFEDLGNEHPFWV